MFIRCLAALTAAVGNYRASPDGFVSVRGDNGEITHARCFKQQNCDYSLIEHLEACDFPSVTSQSEHAAEFINSKADLRLLFQMHLHRQLSGASSTR